MGDAPVHGVYIRLHMVHMWSTRIAGSRMGTVMISVVVPSSYDRRGFWYWEMAPEPYGVAGEETILSARELELVIRAYGEWLAAEFAAGGPMRYRVQGEDPDLRRVYAMHTWVWYGVIRRYLPYGDPWVLWDVS